MKGIIATLLTVATVVAISVPVIAQDEEPPSALTAGVTGYDEYLEGLLAVFERIANSGHDLDPLQKKRVIRRAAKPIAKEFRTFLLSVTPDDCYVDHYVAMWVLYGTLEHMADGTANTVGRFFLIPDMKSVAEAQRSTDCPLGEDDGGVATQPTATTIGVECFAAFQQAAAVDVVQDTVEDLDPAIQTCSSVAEWNAASESNPDALDGVDPEVFLGNRCMMDKSLADTALCQSLQ